MDTLALGYTIPAIRACSGLSPVRQCSCRAYWEKMLEKREHISIILDEYGCLRGVVSMEDVIETMTGVEIVDEDDVAVDMQAFAKEKSRRMLRK